MDNLLAAAGPIASSSSNGGKKRRRSTNEHKTVVKGKDGERVDPVLHSIGGQTRAPKSHHSKDDLRPPNMSYIKDKKLRSKLSSAALATKRADKAREESELLLPTQAGLMQPTTPLERTYKVTQSEIQAAAGLATAAKGFELNLEGGGVVANWSRDGRHLAMATRHGSISTLNFQSSQLQSEIHVNETCRDITFLHSSAFHAVAQKKYVFIYDQDGTELHKLKNHIEPTRLAFLPYHYLLASTSQTGMLKYQDTSTGTLIKEHKTKLGGCNVMEVNNTNGILHLGHQNGTMTLWSPNLPTPHIRLLAHLGPIASIAIDPSSASCGRYFSTAGLDGIVKIWDTRSLENPLRQWTSRREIASTSFSQRGLLAVGAGSTVSIYDNTITKGGGGRVGPFGPSPYLTNVLGGRSIKDVKFCPFEDVLGVGTDRGFQTLLVPGSGEPNFDSGEGDMYESAKRKREREVRNVLEKIQPDLITMDPSQIGAVRAPKTTAHQPAHVFNKPTPYSRLSRVDRLKENGAIEDAPVSDDEEEADEEGESAGGRKRGGDEKEKMKMRGRNKSLKRFLRRKKKNVIDPTTIAAREKLAADRARREKAKNPTSGEDGETGALARFGKRRD